VAKKKRIMITQGRFEIARNRQLVAAFVLRGIAHAVRKNTPLAEQDWRSAIAIDADHEGAKIAAALLRDIGATAGKMPLLGCPNMPHSPVAYITR